MNKFFEKIKNSQIIAPTSVLAIICVVVTLALSVTNMLTEGRINDLAKKKQDKAMSELVEADSYPPFTTEINSNEISYNTAVKGDKTIAYIFTTTGKGYGSDGIKVMTAIDTEGVIIAIKIIDASGETPGVGQKVTEEEFYKQFKGESGKIDAITGATISSKAVTDAVNTALKYADEIMNKGDKS